MTYIEKGTKQFTLANLALFTAGLITFSNLYVTQPLLPQFTKEFGVTPTVASLSLSVSTVMLSVSLIFFGSLSEAWGRKKLMTISIFISSILTIIIALSPTFKILLLLRILQGFVFAGVPAIAMAYLGEEVNPSSLGVAMGLYISGNTVGGLFGRIAIGTMTDFFSWKIGLIVLGIFSFLVSIFFVWALPVSKNFHPKPLQWKTLTKSLLSHLKNPSLLCLFGIAFTLMGAFVTLYNYISFKLLNPPYELSHTIVGWIFIVYLVGTFSSTWFGSLSQKFGRQKMLFIGILIMFSGAITTLATSLWLNIVGIVIFTFGFFGAHSTASGWVSFKALENKAQASSLYLFGYYFGSSIFGTIGGIFWMKWSWYGVISFISSLIVVAFLLAITIFLLNRNTPVQKNF